MNVTFDSNSYRRVVDPSVFTKDVRQAEFQKIHQAIVDGRVTGFLSETIATLEGVQNAARGAYFASLKPEIKVEESTSPNGSIGIRFTMGANNSLHPGVHQIVSRWLGEATKLGFKYLKAPRIAAPRPVVVLQSTDFAVEPDSQSNSRLDLYHEILREIEARGVGIAPLKAIGERIANRLKSTEPWYSVLNNSKDAAEDKEIQKAVSEWADGDTIAAHVGYGIDLLCSGDQGVGAGTSVFDASSRKWLEETYSVQFVTISELATHL